MRAFIDKLALAIVLATCAMFAGSAHAQNVAPRSDYAAVAKAVEEQIRSEMKDKHLPSLAIVLVDDQAIVWAQGYGYEDAAQQRPATAHTIFRIGSVSKLFTDLAVMQMVEKGKLDLDAPIQRYLPDFHPENPFGGEITLRELMSHRAGLEREPPVGHYFDDSSPTLAATIASLNQTRLIDKPAARTKYSNAGVAVVGYTLEVLNHQPFAAYMTDAVLRPLGMEESAFSPEPRLMAHMAEGRMWSYDGLDFPAPTFPLGIAPAGAMYASVSDLGLFLSALLADGRGMHGQLVSPESLHAMWQPQFGGPFGLGFIVSQLDGHRMVWHNGAVYGFATELETLPDDKLGVAVVTTVDGANAVTHSLAQSALRAVLASRAKKNLPAVARLVAVAPAKARESEGDYRDADGKLARLEESRDGLSLFRGSGPLAGLKDAGDSFVADSRLIESKTPIHLNGKELVIDDKHYERTDGAIPPEAPAAMSEYLGEYGWDYDKLYVFEDGGKLQVLMEWFDFEPLELVAKDLFQLPKSGLYDSETVRFQRDSIGVVNAVNLGNVIFKRRDLPKDGEVFQIQPLRPVAELRALALKSKPPAEHGEFRAPDLVQLNVLDPTIKLDIRYAGTHNFLGSPLYLQSRAYMQRPAAEAVVKASQFLKQYGYGLLIHDSYRPWYVTKMFWEGTPEDKRIFVADPSKGSRHNRGCAVDLTLYDLKTGKAVQMTGGYDEMSERSYPYYPGGTAAQRWRRNLLRRAMEAQGFTVYEFEWWHFDYKDWPSYPILNLTFEQLEKR